LEAYESRYNLHCVRVVQSGVADPFPSIFFCAGMK